MDRTVARVRVNVRHSARMTRNHPRIVDHGGAMQFNPSTARRAGILIGIATVVVAIGGAVLIRVLDPDEFPTIPSGLWWAVQTVTTVGYGDHVPTSTEGKVIAGVVMVTGIGFLSVVTASISAAFVESARRKRGDENELAERLDRIERALEELKRTSSPGAGDAPSSTRG
jgi:voltage-gated potassium channel